MDTRELAINPGQAAARERALRGVRSALGDSSGRAMTPDSVIPVDAHGWEAVLCDAEVAPMAVAFVDALLAPCALDVNDPQVIGGQLRHALLGAVALQDQLLRRVEQASCRGSTGVFQVSYSSRHTSLSFSLPNQLSMNAWLSGSR